MLINVKVEAGAKKEAVEEVKPNYFHVKVKEPARNNRANGRVLELISRHLGVEIRNVQIVNGHHAPKKILKIES